MHSPGRIGSCRKRSCPVPSSRGAPLDVTTRPYFDRPYRVINAGRFAADLRDSVAADEIRRLPMTGAVDQFVDSTDALSDLTLLRSAIEAQLPG